MNFNWVETHILYCYKSLGTMYIVHYTHVTSTPLHIDIIPSYGVVLCIATPLKIPNPSKVAT